MGDQTKKPARLEKPFSIERSSFRYLFVLSGEVTNQLTQRRVFWTPLSRIILMAFSH